MGSAWPVKEKKPRASAGPEFREETQPKLQGKLYG